MNKILYILTIVLATACSQEKQTSGPIEPPVAAIESSRMTLTTEQAREKNLELVKTIDFNFGEMIRSNGYIDVPPEGRASVSAFYGGYIKKLELIPGQTIKQGEVLMTLENPDYLEMQQEYLSTLRQLDYLSDDYQRQKTLLDENISSRKSFLKAEAEYKTAVANLEGLKQKLNLLGISLKNVESGNFTSVIYLRSPISGYITEVLAVQGQFLPPAQPAVNIINPDHLHLEIQVFEKDLPDIAVGQKIRMRLPSSETNKFYPASVYLVGKDISGENRIALVHAHLDSEADEKRFTPGMYIETDILLNEDIKTAVPDEAIHNNGSEAYIWVTNGSDWPLTFEKMNVSTGRKVSGYTEITSEFNTDKTILSGKF